MGRRAIGSRKLEGGSLMDNYPEDLFPITRRVCEEFIIHQVSKHRRPVYRSAYGDIILDITCLQSFLASYFRADDMTAQDVEAKMFGMLDIYNLNKPTYFASLGSHPGLRSDGIRVIEDVLDYLAEKIATEGFPAH